MAEELDPQVRLVVDFLNTVDVERGTDLLGDERSYRRWLREHHLPGRADLGLARTVRDGLRAAVDGEVRTAAVLGRVPVSVSVAPDGRPVVDSHDAVGKVVTAAVALGADDRWSRLKLCPADDCRWAFYDRSRNRSRTWCAMSVCGNRNKTRTFRERHRDAP